MTQLCTSCGNEGRFRFYSSFQEYVSFKEIKKGFQSMQMNLEGYYCKDCAIDLLTIYFSKIQNHIKGKKK